MRRFIVHIGAHKTGTTAFQMWLKANRSSLLPHGILVPEKSPQLGNHRGMLTALADQISTQQRVVQMKSAILREFAAYPDSDILASAEALCGAETRTILPQLSAAIDDIADEKVAILVVRDQVAHFNSGFAQRRKAMRNNERDFGVFVRESMASGRGDWRAIVQDYEAHGFRMFVLPYNAEFKALGVARSILSLPIFDDLADNISFGDIEVNNPSMGAVGLMIMDIVRSAIDPEGTIDTRAPSELRERVAAIANERLKDAAFNGFSDTAREALIKHFAEGNDWIAERFLRGPWNDICPPAPTAPVSPQRLTDLRPRQAAAVERIAARMIAYALSLGNLTRHA